MIGGTNTGGGGLNMKVVGAATQPEHAVNNTLWIETSTPIHDWFVQATEPTTPAEGDAWITWRATASSMMDIATVGTFLFLPGVCRQYESSAWVEKNYSTYINGVWTDGELFLYKTGSWNTKYTHSVYYNSGGNTFTETDQYFQIGKANSGTCYVHIDDVDMTGVEKIKFDVQSYKNGYSPYYYVRVTGPDGTKTVNVTSQTTRGVVEIDVSDYSGKHQVQVGHSVSQGTASSGWVRCFSIQVV